MRDRRYTVWMPSEPPRTVFRSLARPANAEGLFHRRPGPPNGGGFQCTQGMTGRNWTKRLLHEFLGADVVPDDLSVERLGIDHQERRCLAPVTADPAQRGEDVLALYRLEAPPGGRRGGRCRAQHLGRKVSGLDLLPLAQDDRALNGVQELADVARPAVRLERGESRGAEPLDAVRGVGPDEGIGQQRHVVPPLAQRRGRARWW